jgi:CheY-like chemotaxis protein
VLPAARKTKGSRRRGSPSSSPGPAVAARRDGIVLIVDDDETTRLVLQRGLTRAGWLALPVDDGGEIWPILERETVSALVLDLNMPGVNGWEVLRTLRTDVRFRTRRIRVIVVSAQSDDETRSFALRLGADGFLSKPVDLDVLRDVLPHAVS